jgi:hypothetical protein
MDRALRKPAFVLLCSAFLLGLLGLPGGAAALPRGASVLANRPSRTIPGTVARGEFGQSLVNAGDLNGDGCDDLAVAVPAQDSGPLLAAGAVVVYSGFAGINSSSGLPCPLGPRIVLHGTAAFAQRGFALPLGPVDLDHDGFMDLVDTQVREAPGGGPGEDAFHFTHGDAVCFFHPTAPSCTVSNPGPPSSDPADDEGYSLAIGVNQALDLCSFVAFGAPGNQDKGAVRLYDCAGLPIGMVNLDEGGSFGTSLASCHLDGDNLPDLVVGDLDLGEDTRGGIRVFLSGGLFASIVHWGFDGGPGEQLGFVANAGNADGVLGGVDDILAAGIKGPVYLFRGEEIGQSSSAVTDVWVFHPESVGAERRARHLAGDGDVNGDGMDDILLVVGTTVHLFLGSSTGPSLLPDWSSSPLDPATYAVFAGDIDGDGKDDILTSHPYETVAGDSNTGVCRVYTTTSAP